VALVEILGDDEEDRTVTERPPVDPGATVWAPQSSGLRPGAPYDRSATTGEAQTRRTPSGRGPRTAPGGISPALDLGEQARDPAWEQAWNTDPIPLETVRVESSQADADGSAGDAGVTDLTDRRQPAGGTVPGQRVAPQRPPAPPQSPRALLLGTLASAEALAVAGVLIAVVTATSSFPSLFAFVGSTGGPKEQFEAFATMFTIGGLLAAALGVAACLRLKPDTHPVVRGLAGGAVILGVVLLVLAAVTTIQAGDLPSPTDSDYGSSDST
jgi:hypothetical protein